MQLSCSLMLNGTTKYLAKTGIKNRIRAKAVAEGKSQLEQKPENKCCKLLSVTVNAVAVDVANVGEVATGTTTAN